MSPLLMIQGPPKEQGGRTPKTPEQEARVGFPLPRALRPLVRIALLLLVLAFCLGAATPSALAAGKAKIRAGSAPEHKIETRPPPPTECPDAEVLGEALALVMEANPVLGAEREQLAERARQKGWENYLSLGYSTNTSFASTSLSTSESGEAGANAAIRVRIPLFDRKGELALAEARAALRKSEDGVLTGFLSEVGKLCDQGAKVQELETLRRFYQDRLRYRQERVDQGLEEAPVLWAEAEQVQKSEHEWRREAQALSARGLNLARQYAGAEWKRLQALLGAMRR